MAQQQQTIPQAKYTHPIPKYDGTSCARSFLQKFQNAMSVNNWQDRDGKWLPILIGHLTGSAEFWYCVWIERQRQLARAAAPNNPNAAPAITYDMLTDALKHAFLSHSDPNLLEDRCKMRKQLVNEKPECYTFNLLALLNEYDNDMPETEQIRYLIRNSRPEYQEQVTVQNPRTIADFLDTMRRIESTLPQNRNVQPVATTSSNAAFSSSNQAAKNQLRIKCADMLKQIDALTTLVLAQHGTNANEAAGPRNLNILAHVAENMEHEQTEEDSELWHPPNPEDFDEDWW